MLKYAGKLESFLSHYFIWSIIAPPKCNITKSSERLVKKKSTLFSFSTKNTYHEEENHNLILQFSKLWFLSKSWGAQLSVHDINRLTKTFFPIFSYSFGIIAKKRETERFFLKMPSTYAISTTMRMQLKCWGRGYSIIRCRKVSDSTYPL